MWDRRSGPWQPWAGCMPQSSLPGSHLCRGPAPFSPSVLPRLLLPRDKLCGSPPEWDWVKFRSSSAPSSSATVGTVRCTLETAGWPDHRVGAPMGTRAGRITFHPSPGPHSREQTPLPAPSKPEVLALRRGPPGKPQMAMGPRRGVGLQPHSGLFGHIFGQNPCQWS